MLNHIPVPSILKRVQGDASLTIMIQPAATGSKVKIFAEGLDWTGGDKVAPAPPKKAAKDAADDIEAEAQKQLDDALKNLPK